MNAFVVDKGTACTETYLVIGGDLNLSSFSAKNIVKYLKTKFARYLISIAKASQDASRATYKFVPNQNFLSNSDVDWTKAISDIDQQLYKKYGLSDDEIKFIETKVQPMD